MDIVYAKPDPLIIRVFLERTDQFAMAPRCLDRDDIGIDIADRMDNVVEFAVAHMRMDLCRRPHGSCRHPESLDSPVQIMLPVAALERESLPQRRFVHLDHFDS